MIIVHISMFQEVSNGKKKDKKKKKISWEERHENCFPDDRYYYFDE